MGRLVRVKISFRHSLDDGGRTLRLRSIIGPVAHGRSYSRVENQGRAGKQLFTANGRSVGLHPVAQFD